MTVPASGFISHMVASDAVADKNGYLLYRPDRAHKLWRLRRLFWQAKSWLGFRAAPSSPRVIRIESDAPVSF